MGRWLEMFCSDENQLDFRFFLIYGRYTNVDNNLYKLYNNERNNH